MPQELKESLPSQPARRDRVVDLNERRLQQLKQSIQETRFRLDALELRRFRTEIKTGRLKRQLARHIHELEVLRQQLAKNAPDPE